MLRPRHPAGVAVDRGFRRLAHGDVHYRAGGRGPVVLALHESPRSSLSMLPVIEALAGGFHVVAPDTPGYGLSDPLPGDAPALEDFVGALAGFLDSLGLARVAVYGAHTGAALALALAAAHPERVTAVLLEGLSAFTPPEVEAFRTRYLAPYEPAWDGAHVMRTWSRVRDLFTWFPWYEQSPDRRLGHEPPGLETLQRSALGFIQSGRHYAKAYTRAAAFQPDPVLAGLTCPVTIMSRPDDLIADHLERITPGPTCTIRRLGPAAEEWRATLLQVLAGARDDADTVGPCADSPEGSRFVKVGEGWLHAVLAGPAEGAVRVLLPGLPGDLEALLVRERAAHPHARLVALNPPGCGWSDPISAPGAGLPQVTAALTEALKTLGLGPPESLAAEGASVVIAGLWARGQGWPLTAEAISPPGWLAQNSALPTGPLLQPEPTRWDGAHLTSAWFQARDLVLYDTPPAAGVPLRQGSGEAPDLEAVERSFRRYVEGPECADLLAAVVAHVRTERGAEVTQPAGR